MAMLISPSGSFGQEVAQTAMQKSLAGKIVSDVEIFLDDAGMFLVAPADFGAREWVLTGSATGTTIALMAADSDFKRWIGGETQKGLNGDLLDIPTGYGNVAYASIFSFGTYATGLISGNDEIRTTGRMLIESIAISGVSVMMIRFVFGRNRPYGDNSPWGYNWFEWSNRLQAFPSGHTMVAFAISTVLAERIGSVWARVGFYGMASLTGIARVRNNQHWTSDVVAGGLVGLLAGLHVVHREEEREQCAGSEGSRFEVTPYGDGMKLTWWLR